MFSFLALWAFGSDQSVGPTNIPKPGKYSVRGESGHAAWVVRGSGFTLDLTNRALVGSEGRDVKQDAFQGTGVLLDGCKDVTLKNANVSGFQHNIELRNCTNVRVVSCSLNKSLAIRMGRDGVAVEKFLNLRDLAAWRTYGAGIWLEACDACRIQNCNASQAQNGIVLVDSSRCTINDNQCSYNGGWGIALWKSTHNKITWNRADFCNRPWAGGWGGDAAGLAAVNGSSLNEFVANSITHGGDGFFLTDRVNGGFDKATQKYKFDGTSDRNLIAYNDGSWSSNNAFEGTFAASNIYFKNIADDSNYGFWLGFSSHSFILQNEVMRNRTDGIAIGQGQLNTLFRNTIEENQSIGVHIWSDAGPVETDQPSLGNIVIENRITGSNLALSLERSIQPQILGNTIERATMPQGITLGFPSFAQTHLLSSWVLGKDAKAVAAILLKRPASWTFYRDTTSPKGGQAIKVGEYAPRP